MNKKYDDFHGFLYFPSFDGKIFLSRDSYIKSWSSIRNFARIAFWLYKVGI